MLANKRIFPRKHLKLEAERGDVLLGELQALDELGAALALEVPEVERVVGAGRDELTGVVDELHLHDLRGRAALVLDLQVDARPTKDPHSPLAVADRQQFLGGERKWRLPFSMMMIRCFQIISCQLLFENYTSLHSIAIM